MSVLTPREIVEELDQYIIGQDEAKRKVAIALRNRWRRQQLSDDLRDEVVPKNIIMIGPTGVGKTEIARRLSRLADAPFVKVEASKFTEVGYVGRDCESMVRELVEVAVNLVREEMTASLRERAQQEAEKRLLDLLLPPQPRHGPRVYRPGDPGAGDEAPANGPSDAAEARTREILLAKLRAGDLDDREVRVEVRESAGPSMMQVFSNAGIEEMGVNLQEMFGRMLPQRTRERKVTVTEARDLLEQEALQDLVDMDAVVAQAIERTENAGIIFLDEIDKIAGRGGSPGGGPDVSREGVQRDILPIVEGSTVTTKHGPVRTDHILFIAAGAFHASKVSDLIPELQGRFPIRVELNSLRAPEFVRILREPKNSLIKQYQAMLATEGITITFDDEAIERIAEICQRANEEAENIGARRLHTVLEYLLEEVSFDAPSRRGDVVRMDVTEVDRRLSGVIEDRDLSKYIL
ncbi:MAG TPA: ATP-dependent protease ATPase subunit HslU [Candidatus Hydrogenedentes bacterium]|nr:ATP-dependent protease ATPase subunit HslU [Candidatus Hydrogenedentota bacterium]HPG67246.1 ATP-dependent protease ATPase subunit HslU [Candidatus Hydrogenedentota bacterium]